MDTNQANPKPFDWSDLIYTYNDNCFYLRRERVRREVKRIIENHQILRQRKQLSSAYNNADSNSYGIVLEINKTDKIIRLYDIDRKAEINLNYTGATNILDKYGQAIAIGQVEIGLIVDVAYESHNKKLISLQTSSRAWEYIGVNNMTLEPDNKIIKIANAKYTYENPVVIDNDKFITMEDLAIQDELTIQRYR